MNATRTTLAAGAALAAVLAFAGCTAGGGGMGGNGGMDHDGTGMRQTDGADEANQADIMFAQMMIPHHQQAIEMSEIILAKDGVDPDVVELAEQIKAAQAPEIEQMESWLDDWGVPSMMDGDADSGNMGGMGMNGMLSDDEIDELEAADGATGTTLFLEGMIEHHEGAIDMAEQHQRNGKNEAELELSAAIITSQTAEIELMKELLAR